MVSYVRGCRGELHSKVVGVGAVDQESQNVLRSYPSFRSGRANAHIYTLNKCVRDLLA